MRGIFLSTVGLLLITVILAGCGVPEEEYNKVKNDLEGARIELSQAKQELTNKNAEVQQLEEKYNEVKGDLEATTIKLSQAIDKVSQKESELAQLEDEFNLLQTDYDFLEIDYDLLQLNYDSLALDYDLLQFDYDYLQAEHVAALTVPYTAISGRQVTSAWSDMDGDLYKWTWPMDIYRVWIEKPKPGDTVRLRYEPTGDVYTLINFVPYVRSEFFEDVVAGLYQRSAGERVFAREVFNIVTQLTVYSEDIGEVPRWPVETLTEAGGDCEDLAILFASLLKAAPYPYKISLVYMDSDNPTDPQDVNHVIVWVGADDWALFAECTSDQGWDYYEQVVGWYYEL